MSRMDEGESDEDLVLLTEAARGDVDAFVELWPRLRLAAIGQAYVWLGTGPEALGAVVAALADLFDEADLDELDPAVPLSSELAAAVRDHAVEALQARVVGGEGPPEDLELRTALRPEAEASLLDGLAALPRRDREALWLVAALRLHVDDAAAVMGEGADGSWVTEASDRAAETLEGHWRQALVGSPEVSEDPVDLLASLVPEGPPAEDLWGRVDRRRSGLDIAGHSDGRLTLAFVGGAGLGVGIQPVADDLWPDETVASAIAVADHSPLVPVIAPSPPPPASEPRRPRRRMAALAAAAVVLLLLAGIAGASLLRDKDDTVSTAPVDTTTTTTTTTFGTLPPTSATTFTPIVPPTAIPTTSPPPAVVPVPVRPATSTTRRQVTTSTTARPTPAPAFATFDDRSVAGVPVNLDETTAHSRLVEKFGSPTADNVLSDVPDDGCPGRKGRRREASWPGFRVAYVGDVLEFWQLVPGRTDLAIPGDVRIDSTIGQVRSAGYDVPAASTTFQKDTSGGDQYVIFGELTRSDNTGKVKALSNRTPCGSTIFSSPPS